MVSTITHERKNNVSAWAKDLTQGLTVLARQFPLPSTFFLIAREEALADTREALEETKLGQKIIAVQKRYLHTFLASSAEGADDILMLMAMFYRHLCLEIEEDIHT